VSVPMTLNDIERWDAMGQADLLIDARMFDLERPNSTE